MTSTNDAPKTDLDPRLPTNPTQFTNPTTLPTPLLTTPTVDERSFLSLPAPVTKENHCGRTPTLPLFSEQRSDPVPQNSRTPHQDTKSSCIDVHDHTDTLHRMEDMSSFITSIAFIITKIVQRDATQQMEGWYRKWIDWTNEGLLEPINLQHVELVTCYPYPPNEDPTLEGISHSILLQLPILREYIELKAQTPTATTETTISTINNCTTNKTSYNNKPTTYENKDDTNKNEMHHYLLCPHLHMAHWNYRQQLSTTYTHPDLKCTYACAARPNCRIHTRDAPSFPSTLLTDSESESGEQTDTAPTPPPCNITPHVHTTNSTTLHPITNYSVTYHQDKRKPDYYHDDNDASVERTLSTPTNTNPKLSLKEARNFDNDDQTKIPTSYGIRPASPTTNNTDTNSASTCYDEDYATCWNGGYDVGYDDGYDEGFDDGFNDVTELFGDSFNEDDDDTFESTSLDSQDSHTNSSYSTM